MAAPFEVATDFDMKRFGHPVKLLLTVPQSARLA
jgi:hypothetical protein